jgi:hypothetical protein
MCIWRTEISPKEFAQIIGKEMVLAHGHRVEYAPRAEFGPIFNFYMGKNTPACVAEAATANQAAQRRQTPAPQPVAYTSARQRPERKDYIMDRLVVPVEE